MDNIKLRTIILDDDVNSIKAAEASFVEYDEVEIKASFTDPNRFFEYIENNETDLVVLDIELGTTTGFNIARRLHEINADIMVIFLTGHSSYAVDSFDFQPVYFLTKPINPVKLDIAMECVKEKRKKSPWKTTAKMMFKCMGEYKIIEVSKICYVERRARKNILVTEDEEIQIAYYTMAELINMLEKYNFFMCHQSFIISLSRVTGIREASRLTYEAAISGRKERVPVSRKQYENLRKALSDIQTFTY